MLENNEKDGILRKIPVITASLVFLLLEILILAIFSKNDEILNFRSIFWISHFILSVIFIVACRYIFKESMGYYDVFVIIFPAIGIFLFILDEIFSLWKVKKAIADEVLGKDRDKREIGKMKKDCVVSEFDVMSSYDLLLSTDNNKKKKFIFSYEGKGLKPKVEILQRALQDENTEVIHYAATELNKLDTGIQEKINVAEREREKASDIEELKRIDYRIYSLYKEYIDSGLLFGEILDFYQNKALGLLENLQTDKREKEILMIELYENMGDRGKYEYLLKNRIDKYMEPEIITRYLKFLHKENRFEELLNEYGKYGKGNEEIEKPVFLEMNN